MSVLLPTDPETLLRRVENALAEVSCIDGAHHKQWIIDQMVRVLTGPEYGQWVKEYEQADENGEKMYEWDTGCAP